MLAGSMDTPPPAATGVTVTAGGRGGRRARQRFQRRRARGARSGSVPDAHQGKGLDLFPAAVWSAHLSGGPGPPPPLRASPRWWRANRVAGFAWLSLQVGGRWMVGRGATKARQRWWAGTAAGRQLAAVAAAAPEARAAVAAAVGHTGGCAPPLLAAAGAPRQPSKGSPRPPAVLPCGTRVCTC